MLCFFAFMDFLQKPIWSMMLFTKNYTFCEFFSITKIMYISYYENVKKSINNWHILVKLTCLCKYQKVYISGMAKTQGAKGDLFVKINKGGGCEGQEGHAICMRKGGGCH